MSCDRGIKYLRQVREAESGALFSTVELCRAFTNVGAKVCKNDSGSGLEITYGSHTAHVPFVAQGRGKFDSERCYKPAGLPIYNIFSAVLN